MGFEGERTVALSRSRICAVLVAFAAVMLVMLLTANPAWAQAVLTVNKTGSPGTVVAGEEITYTIVVTNTGTDPALLTTLTDDLPDEVTLVPGSATTTQGTCVESPDAVPPAREVTCALGTLDPGRSATITIRATATTPGTAVNTACANTNPTISPDVCDTATTTIVPELEIVKLDRPDPVRTGDLLLYTIRVTDVGGGGATNVVVTDLINFDNVDFVEIDSADFDCVRNADRIRCTGGTIAPGDDSTIELVVRPRREGTLRNTATVGVGGFVIDEATTTTTVRDDAPANPNDPNNPNNPNNPNAPNNPNNPNTPNDGTNNGDGNGDGAIAADNDGNTASAGGVSLTCEQLIKLSEGGGAAATQYSTEVSQRCEGSANVLAGTVPGKTLANTGGPPFGLLVASLLLVGGGLLVRATLRR